MSEYQAGEHSPLLKHGSRTSYTSLRPGSIESLMAGTPEAPSRSPRFILAMIILIVGLFSLADSLANAPLKRVYESIACYRHYEAHDPSKLQLGRDAIGPGAIGGVEESLCKVKEVQVEVAHIIGWQFLYDGIPALIMAIPVGILADRMGRKPMIAIGLITYVARSLWIQTVCWFWQFLPLRLVWLSAFHAAFSGGLQVLVSILLVVVSDVSTAANRATIFLCISGANMGTYFIGPPISAALMTINPWIPLLTSTAIFACLAVIHTFVPETLGYTHHSLPPRPASPPPSITASANQTSTSFAPRHLLHVLHARTAFLYNDIRLPLIMSIYIPQMLAGANDELQIQYASKTLRTTFARATLYISVGYGSKFLVLLLLLPAISAFLLRRGYTGQRKDFLLAKCSPFFAAAGWVLVGFARSAPVYIAGLVVLTLGYGVSSMARSCATSLVRRDDVAKLYTVICLFETLIMMGAGPAVAGLWEVGLDKGERVYGLSSWVVGGLFLVIGVVMCAFVRLRKGEEEVGEEIRDEEISVETEAERVALFSDVEQHV